MKKYLFFRKLNTRIKINTRMSVKTKKFSSQMKNYLILAEIYCILILSYWKISLIIEYIAVTE